MVKNEKTTGESCAQRPCRCAKVLPIVTFVLLVPTLILSVMAYLKINSVFKSTVELQFANESNLNKLHAVTQIKEYQEQITKKIDDQVEQLKKSITAGDEENQENGQAATSEVVNTDVAIGDAKWAANSEEAFKYFGLQGTPGNVVINTKTGNYKAIGGAYPQSEFEAAVAAVKAGSATTDGAGRAGTLTQEQVAGLLKGVHYYKNEGAEIMIVEYSDILCPFCQRHYNAKTIENIVDADNTVGMVFKNMPIARLHPTAPIGAKGVECAGKIAGTKAFYTFLEKAFTYTTFNNDNVTEIATAIGLDKNEFAACFTK